MVSFCTTIFCSQNKSYSAVSPAFRLFAQLFVQAQIKENIKATGDLCISLTQGQ